MSHISETESAKETMEMKCDTETRLGNSLFQLPMRRRPAQATDKLKERGDANLTDPGLDDDDEHQEPWLLLHPAEQAFSGKMTAGTTEREHQFTITDMAFERLVRGDVELVEAYLDAGACIEHENRDGLTLLVMAIEDSNIAMTRLLLQKGADVQHRAQGKPPLFYAVRSHEHGPKLIRLLLDHGANIDTTCGTQRMNALHWASATGMLDAADYLISRGIDIESTCAGAHTALHVAAGTGHMTIAKLLLAQGAELSKRSGLGGNALTFATCNGHLEIVKLCVEEGLPVDDCDEKGLTEYRLAAAVGATLAWSDIISRSDECL